MRKLVAIFTLCFSTAAHAQYKCTVGGKSIYSDQPCARDAQHVGQPHDRVTKDQQIQRLEQSIKERKERNRIERREAIEDAAREEADQAHRQQAARNAQIAAADKKRRCEQLQRDLKWNERSVARYQDFGWQRSLTQQEIEAKRNREAMDRECR